MKDSATSLFSDIKDGFFSTLDQLGGAVVLTTREGVICYVNSHFCSQSGFTREELIGATPRLLRSGKTAPEVYEKLWATILSGKVWRGEIQNKRKDGELYWESICISPICDIERRVEYFLGVSEDISARKNLEGDLFARLERMGHINEHLQEFNNIVSHDLQGLLANIKAVLCVVSDRYYPQFDDRTQKLFSIAQSSLQSAIHLVHDLLLYSRSEKKTWVPVNVNMRELVEGVLGSLYKDIEVSGARILVQDLSTVFGNPTLLRELIYNVLSNALKYHSERVPEITISSRNEGDDLVLIIRDNGIGIAPGELQEVVSPFKRGSNVRSISGTGLGLSLCKRIAELHNGSLRLESVLGHGTTVYITLPKKVLTNG